MWLYKPYIKFTVFITVTTHLPIFCKILNRICWPISHAMMCMIGLQKTSGMTYEVLIQMEMILNHQCCVQYYTLLLYKTMRPDHNEPMSSGCHLWYDTDMKSCITKKASDDVRSFIFRKMSKNFNIIWNIKHIKWTMKKNFCKEGIFKVHSIRTCIISLAIHVQILCKCIITFCIHVWILCSYIISLCKYVLITISVSLIDHAVCVYMYQYWYYVH